jgi:NitT/TauT family transport system substrate-binding protein
MFAISKKPKSFSIKLTVSLAQTVFRARMRDFKIHEVENFRSRSWFFQGLRQARRFAFFCFLAGFLHSSLAADESLQTVRVGFFPNITHAQALVASNMTREGTGWFESRLGTPTKIEWHIYNAGPSAMEAFFTKSIDFTYVGPSPAVNAHARSNGKEVHVIAGAMRGGEALVVRGEGISSPDDFRGKTISTPQLGNTQDVECRAWLIDHGIKVTLVGGDARVIPTANPDMLQLFTQGKLDAAWTVEPWVTRLLNEADGRIFHMDPHAITTVLAARSGFVNDTPEIAQRFAAAHEELTAWMIANPEQARRRIRDELSAITRREIPQSLVDEAWPRLLPDTSISVEPFEKFLEKARKVGFLRAEVNLQNLIWKP